MYNFKEKVFKESMRYLRVKYEHEDRDLEGKIHECIEELDNLDSFKFLIKTFEKKIEKGKVSISQFVLESNDIVKLLDNSKTVFVFACTLGVQVDKLINMKLKISTYEGMIYDSVSSAYIEEKLECAIHDFHCETGNYFTSRFSPGYGDLELSEQKKLAQILEYEKIGINLSESNILIPRKSVTGIFGDDYMHYERINCDSCDKVDCSYRGE